MNIGKKVAVLTVAAGALIISGAGGASAHSGGGFNPWGVIQTNHCDTKIGDIIGVEIAAPGGDINAGAECLNFTNNPAAVQSNDCETATGLITPVTGTAPGGDINVGAKCTNIAISDNPYGNNVRSYGDKGYGDKGYGGGHGF
ncbi:hypothetical protein [Streptomyces botrytidirepellens]|uniref:hypothetical protein n=1 Tax=Streptomyces botrytidirepellens TaxID=2486417 RepID=UPI00161AB4DF|nr:hypothetical protein [Streptomyces botrytidirepellens]